MQGYLRKFFYKPCGLEHWAPSGSPDQMDYVGQCNDGYFRLSYQGRLKCIQGSVKSLNKNQILLENGENIPCDVLVVASGLKFNHKPRFLEGLKLGKTIQIRLNVFFILIVKMYNKVFSMASTQTMGVVKRRFWGFAQLCISWKES